MRSDYLSPHVMMGEGEWVDGGGGVGGWGRGSGRTGVGEWVDWEREWVDGEWVEGGVGEWSGRGSLGGDKDGATHTSHQSWLLIFANGHHHNGVHGAPIIPDENPDLLGIGPGVSFIFSIMNRKTEWNPPGHPRQHQLTSRNSKSKKRKKKKNTQEIPWVDFV